MADTKDATQKDRRFHFRCSLRPICFFSALRASWPSRSGPSPFSDSIVFLEAASVSVLLSPGLKWSLSGRKAFARFARTSILIPTCFMFWMIAANYYGAEIPSAAPMGTIGALLLLTNIACLIVLSRDMFAYQAGPCSHVRSHAIMNAAIILAAFLTWGSGTRWPDVLVGVGILYMNADAGERVELAARSPPARAA